jgi:mono/diheme cytochrome c family protein
MFRIVKSVALVGLPLAAAAAAAQLDQAPPRWMANIARKQHVIMDGIPKPYGAATDSSPDTPAKLMRGRQIFDQQCASCHGWSGHGTGPDSFGLVPAPADLEWLARTPKDKSGPYVYWTIAEGGESFGSEMPAFKATMSESDIWAVTAYLRAGMPGTSP